MALGWARTGMLALLLAGCGMTAAPVAPPPVPVAVPAVPPPSDFRTAARTFVSVIERVEPVAEAYCREKRPDLNCDFRIVIDDRRGAPPNAFHTLDPQTGQPLIGFTLSLIADARNADELAFVLGHEAGHHIAGHIPRARDTALAGALILGTLAALGGGDAAVIRSAQDVGASVGARTYSKDFELEADVLGTVVAHRAGFDPERGAGFFGRLPDPGNRFLGSHPPNAQRIGVVSRTAADLRAGRIR
jgi:Zn-dependent protease with chaperone function